MDQTPIAESTDGSVAIRELAKEFGREPYTFRRWLLRHDFCVNRRRDNIAILTDAEAAKARFLNEHGVLLEPAPG